MAVTSLLSDNCKYLYEQLLTLYAPFVITRTIEFFTGKKSIMKNKLILFTFFVVTILTSACNERHKNFGVRQQDTVLVGDTSNTIENTVPPNDTLKH